MSNPSATSTSDHAAQPPALERAILETFVYADIFDYPLTAAEVARYVAVPATAAQVEATLADLTAQGRLVSRNGCYALAGRDALFAIRERRERVARRKWRAARRYVSWLAALPFVRMVGVTGTLAMDNVEEKDDIDVFIVTAPGRLWLTRLLAIGVVRLAALAGDELCPNYLVTERNLCFGPHTVYGAREVAQMVPVYGPEVYAAIRQKNGWVDGFLPQAGDPPNALHQHTADGAAYIRPGVLSRAAKGLGELLLRGFVGEALERWEMERKVTRFQQRAQTSGGSVAFSADACKGHFDRHDQAILALFNERLERYGLS
ncbi:MAG: hypothetical protein NZ528_15305 [Caldilineales bacterium]|nr:hypothetical protein [Caldilineales bacterium]